MKDRILKRLFDKSPDVAYLANLDDLGSADELNAVLRQLKQAGLITYRCRQGQGWDDYGDDIDIAAIGLTPAGREKVAALVRPVRNEGTPP